MTISFKTVLQKFSPEQLQRIKHRVSALVAEDPELQRLLAQQPGSEDGTSIDQVIREGTLVSIHDVPVVSDNVSPEPAPEYAADRA